MLFLYFCHLAFVLGHQGLLGWVCLVAKFFNDCFNLTVTLSDHLFSNLALGLNMLILRLFKQLRFQFVLLYHDFFFHLFDFILMSSLHIFNPVFTWLAFLTDLVWCTGLNSFDFFFQAIVFHFEHLLNASVIIEHSVFPSLALFAKLRFQSLILFM